MTRETSNDAWREIVESGILSECHKLALNTLGESPKPITGRELCRLAGHDQLWKRLSELREMEFVFEHPVRRCSVSGKRVLTWWWKPVGEEVAA
jgi:hypothetical protein